MKIVRKEDVTPIKNADGELFYEMLGRGVNLGNAIHHSVGHVEVLKGFSTNKHYHPIAEETYYFIKGIGKMIINNKEFIVKPGDVVLINSNDTHQLFAENEDVEAIVICAPAFEPNNTIFCDK